MKNPMSLFKQCRKGAAMWIICAGVCLSVLNGCHKRYTYDYYEENVTPEAPEAPVQMTLSLSVEDLVFEAKGGWKEFTIDCSGEWTVTGANEWCLPGAVSGSRKAQMKVMVEAYTGTDDRNVILTVKAGELVKTLTVTQKSADALILTKDKIEVPAEGKDISVEVKTNVECKPIVPPAFQTWIKEAPVSKAMETKNFRFTVTANEDSRQREGYIVIDGGELKDTVHIYQAYRTETGTEEACLILSSKTHEAHAAGEILTVELKTNVDYEIMVPENASNWISCLPETRALRTDKLQLIIEVNNETEERQAEVIVKDRNSELSDTLHIRQAAKEPEPEKPFLTLTPQNIEVEAAGKTVEVTVNTNIEYDVIIPQEAKTWITFTKGENNKIQFTITENQSYDESRQAKISVKASASELNGTVTISQAAKPEEPYLTLTPQNIEVEAAGQTVEVTVNTNIEYDVIIPQEAKTWITFAKGENNKIRFTITENQSYDESRQAKISIKASASELNGTVTISQAAKPETPAGNFAQTEYMLKDNAHTKTISFSVPAAWQVSVSYEEATSEWFSISATSGEAGRTNLTITTTENTTKKIRQAYIDVTYGNRSQRLTIRQDADITDKFDPVFAKRLSEKGYIKISTHITIEEVNKIEIVNLYIEQNWDLASLQGIEYLTALTELDCHNASKITSLDLSKNTELTKLKCQDNKLTSLDLSKNTKLTYLDCNFNKLTSLDISKNTKLTYLNCSYNQLSSLDVSKNTELTYLECNGKLNHIRTLDVSKNTKLKTLYCAYNRLTSLDISKNTSLENLRCEGNPGRGTQFPLTVWTEGKPRTLSIVFDTWSPEGAMSDRERIHIQYIKK